MPKYDYELFQNLYDKKLNDQQVALQANCPASAVFKWRKKLGLPKNVARSKQGKIIKPLAKALHDDCLVDNEIAKIFHCSPSSIEKWRGEENLPSNVEIRKWAEENSAILHPPKRRAVLV